MHTGIFFDDFEGNTVNKIELGVKFVTWANKVIYTYYFGNKHLSYYKEETRVFIIILIDIIQLYFYHSYNSVESFDVYL